MKKEKTGTEQKPIDLRLRVASAPATTEEKPAVIREWTKAICPNCGYRKADVDPEGITWCPACGYSKKGCYT